MRIRWRKWIRRGVALLLVAMLGPGLAGCFQAEKPVVVLDELQKRLEATKQYEGNGTMTMYTGQEPLTYQVQMAYLDPHYYRISLQNARQDVTQMILRNDDGVFVLTPQLQKSFRFRSDWPGEHGQVYLYHTLLRSIVSDPARQLVKEGDAWVFEVAAHYANPSLTRQRIWLDSVTYAPRKVEVLDANANKLIDMQFAAFRFEGTGGKEAFGLPENGGETTVPPADTSTGSGVDGGMGGVGVGATVAIEPTYRPLGVTQTEMRDIRLGGKGGARAEGGAPAGGTAVGIAPAAPTTGEPATLLRYTGAYHYTLIESRPVARAATALSGKIIELGGGEAYAVLTGTTPRTLSWTAQGIEFRLTTNDLPIDEMAKVAVSTLRASAK